MAVRRSPVLALDFDGTLTAHDVTDAILAAYADARWQAIEDAWTSGRIGSRECLAGQIALIRASPAELDDLIDGIEIDPGLPQLLRVCVTHRTPVHVVSDGFDYYIRRILGRPGIRDLVRQAGVQVVSSELRPIDSGWEARFLSPEDPCEHGCATCKPAVLRRLTADGSVSLFVGDGLSDRHAVRHAQVVFAKKQLAAFCEVESLPYTPYDTLDAVAAELERGLRTRVWSEATGPVGEECPVA